MGSTLRMGRLAATVTTLAGFLTSTHDAVEREDGAGGMVTVRLAADPGPSVARASGPREP